ncbi:MAG: hypothetical protein VW683_16965 [Betaproteobacteria bacterium]
MFNSPNKTIAYGAGGGGGIVGMSYFTTSGTWDKAAREADLGVKISRVIVEVLGAGGSGNKSTNSEGNYNAGGGGGYAKKFIDVSDISSATVEVGSGGAGITGSVNGNAGGLSSWSDGVNTNVVGDGGSGGSASGSTGGTATGGDLNINGGSSNIGSITNHPGNPSFLGSCVKQGAFMGYGYGSAPTQNSSLDGGNGIVIVTEIA